MISDNTGRHVCILEDFTLCSLDLVKEEAGRTWKNLDHKNSDPYTFTQKASFDPANVAKDKTMLFQQVRSKMITKRIEASVTSVSWKVLFGKRNHFT